MAVTLPTQEDLDAEMGGREPVQVLTVIVLDDGSLHYYTDGIQSGTEAIGIVASLKYIMIEDQIGKTRGFTFN